jgi:hypothetical protein
MRHILLASLALSLTAPLAIAQTVPNTTTSGTMTPGTTTTGTTTTGTTTTGTTTPGTTASSKAADMMANKPAAGGGYVGANSFTESQARGRLEKDGFTNVSSLSKDKDGVWRGRASKGAQEKDVGVDYKGNIVAN